MAAEIAETPKPTNQEPLNLPSYIGLSFAIFLGFIPQSSLTLLQSLQSRNKSLGFQLHKAEEELHQMKSRRKEDSKANARVVEIFASHRNGWQQEERKLLHQIDESSDEISQLRVRIEELEKSEEELRDCVERLQREVDEREEMINFMSRQATGEYYDDEDEDGDEFEEEEEVVEKVEVKKEVEIGEFLEEFEDHCDDFSRLGRFNGAKSGGDPMPEKYYGGESDEMSFLYGARSEFSRDVLASASKVWAERANDGWQDIKYDSLEAQYHKKHFVARRETTWKADCESTGIPSKLKLLEQELLNLERIDKGELSKVPSLMRKQAKRYQSLAGKIDNLCKRMQVSVPSEPDLSSEFRTQRQTEFLLEAHRLQQRAIETRQKLLTLQTETGNSHYSFGEEHGNHAKLITRRSLDSIKSNLKEIQRNLEIWLARIMGDLEGILARDNASHVRDCYISRYPYVRRSFAPFGKMVKTRAQLREEAKVAEEDYLYHCQLQSVILSPPKRVGSLRNRAKAL
ncbi:hypothetical protein GIB67_040866, partial [Kingdonia uniflora]